MELHAAEDEHARASSLLKEAQECFSAAKGELIEALAWVLRRFKPGDRVVAEREIVYGTGQTVEEGTGGAVVRMEPGGVPVVRVVWDALADGDPCELSTSCEFVVAAADDAVDGDPA